MREFVQPADEALLLAEPIHFLLRLPNGVFQITLRASDDKKRDQRSDRKREKERERERERRMTDRE